MDGDFAPMNELVNLRERHGFLLVIDDVSFLEGCCICKKLFQAVLYALILYKG